MEFLPVWQFAGIETWCMIGYHAVPIIADAYRKAHSWLRYQGCAADAMVASATYASLWKSWGLHEAGQVMCPWTMTARQLRDDASMPSTTGRLREWRRPWATRQWRRRLMKRAGFWRNNFNAADGFGGASISEWGIPQALRSGESGSGERIYGGQRVAVLVRISRRMSRD